MSSKWLNNATYDTITAEFAAPHVLLVTLNRPNAANAFNTQMAWDLVDIFEGFSVDQGDIRAIVLTGAGDRAFCAGGDLKERLDMPDDAWARQHLVYERMVRAILACPTPIIGAINGAAYGGGCELVAALDFCYAAQTATFAQTEVRIGIIPGAGGTQTLSRAVGSKRAKEIILSGTPFSAQDALDWGLVNALYPAETLLAETLKTAGRIAANAPIATRQAKRAIDKGTQMSLADGLTFEIEAYNHTFPTKDRREGVAAFNEKRTPKFEGR